MTGRRPTSRAARAATCAIAVLVVPLLAGCGRAHVPIHRISAPGAKQRERDDGAHSLAAPVLPASAESGSWSPDGRSVVFTTFSDGFDSGHSGLFLIAASGGTARPLLDSPELDASTHAQGAWSAGANRIVFASDRDGHDDIDTMAPDGSDIRAVTHHDDSAVYSSPSISADGTQIVFRSQRPLSDNPDSDLDVGSLYRVRSDGSDLTPLTAGPTDGTDDGAPQWSPSGDRILFERKTQDDRDAQIYSMAADGTDIQQITSDSADHTSPVWSPDGRSIAYSSDAGRLDALNIFAIPAAGGNAVQITTSSGFDDLDPAWSPDGRTLLFQSGPAHSDSPTTLWTITVPTSVRGGPP